MSDSSKWNLVRQFGKRDSSSRVLPPPLPPPPLPEDPIPVPYVVGLVSGIAGGIADTVFNYPPYGLHIRKERLERIRLSHFWPRQLFCGAAAYAYGMIPATMLQDGTNEILKRALPQDRPPIADALCAFAGGIVGAMVYTPVGNLIVTQQQLMRPGSGDSVRVGQVLHHIRMRYGVGRLWTGFAATSVRDGMYASAVFWGVHRCEVWLEARGVSAALRNKVERLGFNPTITSVLVNVVGIHALASIIVGTLSSFCSHPFDAIATRMQNTPEKTHPVTLAREIFRKEGIRSFYRGAVFRLYAVIAGIFIVSHVSNLTKQHVFGISLPAGA